MKKEIAFYWMARLVAAIIMAQTLYFKFSASPESMYIFSHVGMEPWGRVGVGVLELIASILILINVTAWLGAMLAAGLMAGAILMHLLLLGIVIMDDHGQLFVYAVVVMICSLFVLLYNKEKIETIARRLFGAKA